MIITYLHHQESDSIDVRYSTKIFNMFQLYYSAYLLFNQMKATNISFVKHMWLYTFRCPSKLSLTRYIVSKMALTCNLVHHNVLSLSDTIGTPGLEVPICVLKVVEFADARDFLQLRRFI